MKNLISIKDVLPDLDHWSIVDVRSPGEYVAGHIPGAVSIPLFSDEERTRIGTLYKQVSPESAMKEGLSIAGHKMNQLLEQAGSLLKDDTKEVLIHCWRGGKRSEAVQWLFNFSGHPSFRLFGGYKSFRHEAHSLFSDIPFELKILGGCTGAGKTEVLKEIATRGHQVIDLEQLAHHKGSAFGSIGEGSQPANEQFENNLFLAFRSMDPTKPVWLENESKSIGRVHLPDGLWHRMKSSVLYTIEVSKEKRLDRALEYYSNPVSIEMLKESFSKIYKRLGGLEYQNAIKALGSGDLRTAASIALTYYDKAYTFQLDHWDPERVVQFTGCDSIKETAERLLANHVVIT